MSKLILTALNHLIEMVSPEIIRFLRSSIKSLTKKAEETPNPWDDVLMNLLTAIIGENKEDH